ncbi:C40 family peptidase [Alloprevotella tannerae]|jgi:gamma-DL-glutamyl hydrolase|uniref:C40 family peptidase n=1 Tax=Alloprevotella tannerae TaxID=76122 RepID=UPI0028E1C5D9|nr:C40 family peptidase [Alloprevotella tannerae]
MSLYSKRKEHLGLGFSILFLLFSCSSHKSLNYDFKTLVRTADRIGFEIERTDDHRLFIEAASWLGTPYTFGGSSKLGVDCSGLTCAIYNNVYGVQLHRISKEQFEKDLGHPRSPEALKQGDLVFFSSSYDPSRIDHVGIFLKGSKFIHASSSKGVVIDDLNKDYWRKHWIAGGTIK